MIYDDNLPVSQWHQCKHPTSNMNDKMLNTFLTINYCKLPDYAPPWLQQLRVFLGSVFHQWKVCKTTETCVWWLWEYTHCVLQANSRILHCWLQGTSIAIFLPQLCLKNTKQRSQFVQHKHGIRPLFSAIHFCCVSIYYNLLLFCCPVENDAYSLNVHYRVDVIQGLLDDQCRWSTLI